MLSAAPSATLAADASAALGMEELAGKVPEFSLVTSGGTRVNSEDWRRKLVVLHFWASWCKPCRVELPELSSLAKSINPARAEVVLIAVDEDKSAEALIQYARELGVELPIYVASLSDIPPPRFGRAVSRPLILFTGQPES